MIDRPALLVVHAVDTEGPLGGDARRLPDGSPEFFDRWEDIEASLAELTSKAFREEHCDSFGRPYVFDWFILDFMGFRTNPKHRVAAYHDTYDHLVALPTEPDAIDWHYHVPPASGAGDEWSETWLSSNECNTILARRLLERGTFPAAFRAGGTIEDDAGSHWLDEVFALDFSNRVSERSRGTGDLYSFDWHGAPARWGSYHPAHHSFLEEGAMRRYIYRCIDLRSRYNELTVDHVTEAMREVARSGSQLVLSYFSHDNRDMRPETRSAVDLLRSASAETGVPWASCTAAEAHRLFHGLDHDELRLEVELEPQGVAVRAEGEPLQRTPFVAAELADGRIVRLVARETGARRWLAPLEGALVSRAGAAASTRAAVVTTAFAER